MFSTAAVALKRVFRKILCDRTGSRGSLKGAIDTEIFSLGGKAGAMSRRKSAGQATLEDGWFCLKCRSTTNNYLFLAQKEC